MKKNKFFIGLIIYCGVYFIFSFILDSSIEYAFINDNDRQILKEEFNQLEETDILFVYRDQARFKPILVVVYRDNQTGEKHHSNILIKSERPKIEKLADKINDNDIIKYFWYFNFINLAILLIAYNIIKRKIIKTKK